MSSFWDLSQFFENLDKASKSAGSGGDPRPIRRWIKSIGPHPPSSPARSRGAGRQEVRRTVIGCKLLYGSLERTTQEGLAQTRAYMDRCGAGEAHSVIFDRDDTKPRDEKIFRRTETDDGPPVTVWGM